MFGALAAILASIGQGLGLAVTRFVMFKIFMTTLLVVALPLLFKNLFIDIFVTFINKAMGIISSDMASATVQFTGLAAHLADHLQIPLFVSILLGAVSTKFLLRVLRF